MLEAEARNAVVVRNRGILAEKIKLDREKERISAEKLKTERDKKIEVSISRLPKATFVTSFLPNPTIGF